MFEGFTERALNAILLAQSEALAMGLRAVGTEMIFLGVVAESLGRAANILQSRGIDLDCVRAAVSRVVCSDAPTADVQLPFTPEASALLRRPNGTRGHVNPDHLILAINAENNSAVAQVFSELGINLEEFKLQVRAELNDIDKAGEKDAIPAIPSSIVSRTQEEARRLGHNFAGTEFLLLGLLLEPRGLAAKALSQNGVSLTAARVEIERIVGRRHGFVVVEVPYTPRAISAIALGLEQARALGENRVRGEHILLGLIEEGGGVACTVFKKLNVDTQILRRDVLALIEAEKQNSAD
jgi:ATP-dependent Clp protease ATP-binding subunit ClpA